MRRHRPLIVIGAATVAIQLFMIVTDMGPDLALVTAATALAGVALWLLLGLGREAVRYETVSDPHAEPRTRLPDLRITLLRQGLSYGRQDNQIPERLYRSLVSLVDHELAAGHGIDRAIAPDAARDLIGEDLARFIESPDRARSLGVDGLTRIVSAIERIRPEVDA